MDGANINNFDPPYHLKNEASGRPAANSLITGTERVDLTTSRDVNENHSETEHINPSTIPDVCDIGGARGPPDLDHWQLSQENSGSDTSSSKCFNLGLLRLKHSTKHSLNSGNLESVTIKQRLEALLAGTEDGQSDFLNLNFSESESSDTSEAVNSEGTTPTLSKESTLLKGAFPSAINQENELAKMNNECFINDDRDVPFAHRTVPPSDVLEHDEESQYLKEMQLDVGDLDEEVLSEESLSASSKILQELVIRGSDIEHLSAEEQSQFQVVCPKDWHIEDVGSEDFVENNVQESHLCKLPDFTGTPPMDEHNVNDGAVLCNGQMQSNSEEENENLSPDDSTDTSVFCPVELSTQECTSTPATSTGWIPLPVPKFHFLAMEEFWESNPATEAGKSSDDQESMCISQSWPGVSHNHRLLRRRQLSQHESRRISASASVGVKQSVGASMSKCGIENSHRSEGECEHAADKTKTLSSFCSSCDSSGDYWPETFPEVERAEDYTHGHRLTVNDVSRLSGPLENGNGSAAGDSTHTIDNDRLSEDEGASQELFFDSLPTEITMNIYSYLTIRELLLYVAPVCRKWYEMAHDPVLWKHFVIHPSENIDSYELCKIIRRATLLKHLSLRAREDLNITEIKMLTVHCMHLQSLNLGFCDNVNEKIIDVITQNCKNLQSLNVEGCERITDTCISYLALLPKLRSLNMSHCIKVTDPGIINLAVLCESIEELNIDGIPWITDNAIKLLATERQHILKAVYLDGAEMTDVTVEYISQCKNLEVFSVSFAEQFTDSSLQYLKSLKNLRHLRLKRGVEYSDKAMTEMFLCPNLHQLTHLTLAECSELSDKALEHIAKGCKKLHHLALCWCWDITENGLVHVIDNCSEMETLDLLGLDKILGMCLMRIPEKMPRLHFLDLRQCNRISDSMLTDLVIKKNNLQIINYYGDEVTPYAL